MTDLQRSTTGEPLSAGVLCVAGGLALIATVVSAAVPALVDTWQTQFGVRADQAGFVAATEFFAQVVGTAVFVWAARAYTWRTCAIAGLTVILVANLASAATAHIASLTAARAVAGIGGGAIRALGMNCLARAKNPGLAFSLYASVQVAIAAAVTALLPPFVATVGGGGLFVVIAALAGIGLCFAVTLPAVRSSAGGGTWRDRLTLPAAACWALAALFVYFLAQGALWTFLGPVGRALSIPEAGITRALALLNLAGLLGSLGIGALAYRVNPLTALTFLLAVGLLSLLSLFAAHTSTAFLLSTSGFYFAWCASFPFQFTLIARADRLGYASATVPAVDALGLACGAALAGACLPLGGVVMTGWICGIGSVLGVAGFTMAAILSKRGSTPQMSA